MRPLGVPTLTACVLATLVAVPSGRAHGTGSHTGFVSTVSYIEPQVPGLLVRVLGGHERLSVSNLTRKTVVILDARGEPFARILPGRTRVWPEPRVGSTDPPPDREGLVRYWRIPGTADGEPFEIVGFLGYRPPANASSDDDRLPLWAIILATAVGLLVLVAALAPKLRQRKAA